MTHAIQHIAAMLKAARKKKKLSQRALSKKTGIPQSHISKIENGLVDLQMSSLIEFSRVVGLEVMLVPCAFIPIVEALEKKDSASTPMYQLDEENDYV